MSKFVFLIPLLPLIGFLINGLGRNLLSRTAVVAIGCGTLILSFILSAILFKEILFQVQKTRELRHSEVRAAVVEVAAVRVDLAISPFRRWYYY